MDLWKEAAVSKSWCILLYMGKYGSFVYSMYVMYVLQVKIVFRLFYF